MERCRLIEYRTGRYAWADPETGQVIRKATDEEADHVLAELFAKENSGGDLEIDKAQGLDAGVEACALAGAAPLEVKTSPPVATGDMAGFYLWVDPRLEPGHDPKTFDQAAFLARADDLFQTKRRWGGQQPAVVLAHPDQAGNGLKPAAKALGLRVVSDPTIAAGTYRLGLVGEKGGAES